MYSSRQATGEPAKREQPFRLGIQKPSGWARQTGRPWNQGVAHDFQDSHCKWHDENAAGESG